MTPITMPMIESQRSLENNRRSAQGMMMSIGHQCASTMMSSIHPIAKASQMMPMTRSSTPQKNLPKEFKGGKKLKS